MAFIPNTWDTGHIQCCHKRALAALDQRVRLCEKGKRNKEERKIEIERRKSEQESQHLHNNMAEIDVLKAQIVRENSQSPWGFRLKGGAEHGEPISISRVSIQNIKL